MELDLNAARVGFRAVDRAPVGTPARDEDDPNVIPGPVKLCHWSCVDDAFTPTSPRKTVEPHAHLRIVDPLPTLPQALYAPSRRSMLIADFFRNTALTGEKLRKLLDTEFAYKPVDVPYAKLIDPFKASESRDLFVQVEYLRFIGDYVAPAALKGATLVPHIILDLPLAVRFFTITEWVCEGDFAASYRKRQDEVSRLAQGRKALVLMRGHAEDISRQRAALKELEDAEKGK